MKTNIVSIGNSQGIRIPKVLLEQSGLTGEVELELCDEGILIRRSHSPREGWAERFRAMAANNDDDLPETPSNSYSKERWRW